MIPILIGKYVSYMKRSSIFLSLSVIAVSCSVNEMYSPDKRDTEVFYATIEYPGNLDTKVFVNQDLRLLWDEGDHISIFNKKDSNDEYYFTGQTGDAGGSFELVKDFSEEGVAIDKVYAVYPYSRTTSIDTKGTLSVEFPSEQYYRENSFGLGDNLMVAVSKDNNLQFKNVGGYLRISLYGEGVSVSSITLKGNNGEKLAGKATVTMPLDGTPTVALAEDATDQITLTCDTPVALGATAEESKDFWFVIPPVSFSKGFTVSISQTSGGVFEKSTAKSISIERSKLSKMSPIEVKLPRNIIYYTSSDEFVVTPYNPESFGVSILSNEYNDGRGILTFDGDVTNIGVCAFFYCTSLTSIMIPDSVTNIGESAFSDCSNLSTITIPDSVMSIGNSAFSNCSNLTNIRIPDSVTSIGNFAFNGCSNLTKITIPDSVTKIGDYAFQNCSSLSSIKLPVGIKNIGIGAFTFCCSLTSITLPNSITNIAEQLFLGSGLSSVIIPENVKSIGPFAFQKCNDLASISIPESVETIGHYAFSLCSNLVSISIPEKISSIESGLFWGCSSLFAISIPDKVTSIGHYAFDGCSSLQSIIIPKDVNCINDCVFSGCSSLRTIIIPEKITSIGYNALTGCINLESIYLKPSSPPLGDATMFNETNNCPIYVPLNSINNYRTAQYWSDYADRIQAIPE